MLGRPDPRILLAWVGTSLVVIALIVAGVATSDPPRAPTLAGCIADWIDRGEADDDVIVRDDGWVSADVEGWLAEGPSPGCGLVFADRARETFAACSRTFHAAHERLRAWGCEILPAAREPTSYRPNAVVVSDRGDLGAL